MTIPSYIGDADLLDAEGTALREQGRAVQAEQCFRQALAISPWRAQTHNNLGAVLLDQGRITEAVASFREALRLDPGYVAALNNLGSALMDLGEIAQAVECFQAALGCDPTDANAHNNLGTALRDTGRLPEAEASFRCALALTADQSDTPFIHASARYNLALLCLLQGRFLEAWPGFEARFEIFGAIPPHSDKPLWKGEDLAGKKALVHAEQGLGDTIQFARYLPIVRQRGADVIFQCQPALVGLFKQEEKITVIGTSTALPPFDVQVPLLSLPGLFGTTLETIPAAVPYVRVEVGRRKYWARALAGADGFKVGIVWQGNPANAADRNRSAPLTAFSPLARVSGVRLFSLQVGTGTEQLATSPFPVHDLGSRFQRTSFADIAAAMVNLDLVVTVETAPAHLAGALGVPVWTVLHYHGDWRWLLERSDSPWYPTMRLFRQSRPGAWDDVFQRIAANLSEITKRRH